MKVSYLAISEGFLFGKYLPLWQNFKVFCNVLLRFSEYFATFRVNFDNFSKWFEMAKCSKDNLAIWSHWSQKIFLYFY